MKGSPGYVDQSVRTSPLLFPPRGPSHGYRQFTITQQWKWAIWPLELFSFSFIYFKKFNFSIIFMNLFHKKDRITKIQSLWHLLSVSLTFFLYLTFSHFHYIITYIYQVLYLHIAFCKSINGDFFVFWYIHVRKTFLKSYWTVITPVLFSG